MSESVVLCEGYHDRAFWKGWLLHLGCTDPGASPPGSTRRTAIIDPWKTPVGAGQYAFRSKTGAFVRIIPCQGRSRILPAARTRLIERTRKRLVRLIINVDPDVSAGGVSTATGLRGQDVEHFVRTTADPGATRNAAGEIEVDGGATLVSQVRWEVADPPHVALPDQQALERLACAAILGAYRARGPAVGTWLSSRPGAPAANPKEHAWSYMAGWYAEHGCEEFYTNLWNDPSIARELELRLRTSGAWQIAELLAL